MICVDSDVISAGDNFGLNTVKVWEYVLQEATWHWVQNFSTVYPISYNPTGFTPRLYFDVAVEANVLWVYSGIGVPADFPKYLANTNDVWAFEIGMQPEIFQ